MTKCSQGPPKGILWGQSNSGRLVDLTLKKQTVSLNNFAILQVLADDEKALDPRLADVLAGRGRPDSKADGVRGKEEKDDVEGEHDADGSLQGEVCNMDWVGLRVGGVIPVGRQPWRLDC